MTYIYLKVWSILDEYLHSDYASRPDNYRKKRYVLSLPPDPVTDEVQYCVHFARELRGNWKTLWILLTGKDLNNVPVEGLQPLRYWLRIAAITKTPERPLGIIGSPKMMSKMACRCFHHHAISQCSCPHCTQFLENLDHRHLAVIQGWRKAPVCIVVPDSAPTSEPTTDSKCSECGGECHDPEGTWRKMSGGLISFLTHMLCPAVELPNVSIASVDVTTGLEIKGSDVPVKMIPRKCWLGECQKCGWNNRFHNFPLFPVTLKEDDESEREVFVRACPREARNDKYTTYHEFRKMERGAVDADGKVYTQTEWTPVTCTRRMFYYQLVEFMRDFLPHYYKVLWHQAWDKVFLQEYRRLAYVGMKDQPQPLPSMKGTAILIKDFAACIDHDRKFNKTCSYPEKSHEWVGVYQCSPYLHVYSDDVRNRRWKKNRNVVSAVRQKVFAIFAFSKRKGDTTFDQTVIYDLVQIMKTGRVKAGCKGEWFWRGKRLLGSSTVRPLPQTLEEATDCIPMHKELSRLLDRRDRCTGQFQGKDAFFSVQEFVERNKDAVTNLVDLSETSCHGKCEADALSNVPTGHLREAAKQGEPVGVGTRGLTIFLASKMKQPESKKSDAWTSVDEYLIAYYPEDAFDKKQFAAKEGYAGSSNDHFFTNSGLHRLATRHLRCYCPACIRETCLYSETNCSLSTWCDSVKHVNLVSDTSSVPSRRVLATPTVDALSLEQFASTLTPKGKPCERVVVCVVHEDDDNELDEPFYLARVVSKARKISENCIVSGNTYEAGHLVVNIKWYQYINNSRGNRIYKLQSGCSKGVIYSVGSILRNVSGIKFDKYDKGRYVLSRSVVTKILNIIK